MKGEDGEIGVLAKDRAKKKKSYKKLKIRRVFPSKL